MKARHLQRDDPESYPLLAQTIERVGKFAVEMDSDASPGFLMRALLQHFAADQPKLAAMVAYDDAGKVHGHILVSLDQWCDSAPFVTVLQYALDHPMPSAWLKESFGMVEAYARAHGATKIRAYAAEDDGKRAGAMDADRRRARAFRIFFGFKEQRVVLQKDVSPSPGTADLSERGASMSTLPEREPPECLPPN